MLLRSLALLSMLAAPAHALSCMETTPSIEFGKVSASPDPYWIVVGEFQGGLKDRIQANSNGDEVNRSFEARFIGHNVNRHGLANPLNIDVTIEENCFASWCSRYQTGQKMLTFLRLDPSGTPVMELNVCNSNAFWDPTKAQMNEIKKCFVTGCALN